MSQIIRVMVIDDSIVYRNWLIQSLSADPRFEVVGFAGNAYEAKQKIPLLKPDLLTLDIEMPGMSGIDFLKQLLPVHPLPVILVSSLNLRVFDALEAGAVDFVRKPDGQNSFSKEIFLNTLKSKLVIASGARVRLPSAQDSSSSFWKRCDCPNIKSEFTGFLQTIWSPGNEKTRSGFCTSSCHRHWSIHRRYRSHSGGRSSFPCKNSGSCDHPAYASRFYCHVCRTFKPHLCYGSPRSQKRRPSPPGSDPYRPRRNADASRSPWQFLLCQRPARRKSQWAPPFR